MSSNSLVNWHVSLFFKFEFVKDRYTVPYIFTLIRVRPDYTQGLCYAVLKIFSQNWPKVAVEIVWKLDENFG